MMHNNNRDNRKKQALLIATFGIAGNKGSDCTGSGNRSCSDSFSSCSGDSCIGRGSPNGVVSGSGSICNGNDYDCTGYGSCSANSNSCSGSGNGNRGGCICNGGLITSCSGTHCSATPNSCSSIDSGGGSLCNSGNSSCRNPFFSNSSGSCSATPNGCSVSGDNVYCSSSDSTITCSGNTTYCSCTPSPAPTWNPTALLAAAVPSAAAGIGLAPILAGVGAAVAVGMGMGLAGYCICRRRRARHQAAQAQTQGVEFVNNPAAQLPPSLSLHTSAARASSPHSSSAAQPSLNSAANGVRPPSLNSYNRRPDDSVTRNYNFDPLAQGRESIIPQSALSRQSLHYSVGGPGLVVPGSSKRF